MGLDPGAASFHGERLGNGVHVLTECMPGVRSVAVGAWVRQGAALDGPGQAVVTPPTRRIVALRAHAGPSTDCRLLTPDDRTCEG